MPYKFLRGKLKRFPFLESNFTLGPMSIIRFITGPLRSKIAAVALGAKGVGFLGTGSQAQMLGVTIGSLSMTTGFTTRMSQMLANSDQEGRRTLLSTAFTLQLVSNGFVVLLGLALAGPVTRLIFGETGSISFIIPLLLSLPFVSLNGTYLQGILFAHGRYDLYTRATTINVIIEATFYILGALYFGTTGAFWAFLFAGVIWTVLLLREITKLESLRDVFRVGLCPSHASHLLKTSGVMLAGGTLTYGVNIILRGLIAKRLGDSYNGIYQVLLVVSAYYTPFLTMGIWARLFPKVSGSGLNDETLDEWTHSLILTAILAASVECAILVMPDKLISLFYTKEFLPALVVLPIQLLGDFFYLISQSCLGVALGLNQRRFYLTIWTLYNTSFCLIAWNLIGSMGLMAVSIGYLSSNFLLAIFGVGLYGFLIRHRAGSKERTFRLVINLALPLLVLLAQVLLFRLVPSPVPRFLLVVSWAACLLVAALKGKFRHIFMTDPPGPPSRLEIALLYQRLSKKTGNRHSAFGDSASRNRDLMELRSTNLLIDGRPARSLCAVLRTEFPEHAIRYIHEARNSFLAGDEELLLIRPSSHSASVDAVLENLGFKSSQLLSFRQTVPFSILSTPFKKEFQLPLTLSGCLCQNDFELLQEARESHSKNLVCVEDRGNLIWGWRNWTGMALGGLILNKPHFFWMLMRKLLLQERIYTFSGQMHADSPLAGLLKASNARTSPLGLWSSWKPAFLVKVPDPNQIRFSIFSPNNWGVAPK